MTTPMELSKFLEPEEKESVLKVISENEKIMSSGVCNVLTMNNGELKTWNFCRPVFEGMILHEDFFVEESWFQNSVERYYRILVVEPSSEAEKAAEIQLDFRINIIILITKMHPKLLVFNNGKDIGLQFHNSKECEQFHESISNRECLLPAVNIDEQETSGSSQLTHGGSVKWRETADNSSKETEQSTVTNLVPAEENPVEISDPTEKEKKVEKCKRIGAIRLPGADLVQLKNNRNRIDATSDERRPSELAHQEHVPELMSDTTSVPAHLPPSGLSELEDQEHVPELMSETTSTPPVPAHRACWTIPNDSVPDIGLQFHNSKEFEQFHSSVRSRKLKREQKYQSIYENLTEEKRKEFHDTIDKIEWRSLEELDYGRKKLLNHIQAEEEKRKSTTEASTSSLEKSQSALELNLPTADNSSKITEPSAVTNLAEHLPAEVDSVETGDVENLKAGSAPTEKDKKLEQLTSELAHQEHVAVLITDLASAPAPRACWTVLNDPESPLESQQLEEPEPVVETEYEKYFAETDGTDAILFVKGKKLHVNKKFLSHRSEYFSRLFISIGKEYLTELVEHEDLAILLSLLMPEPLSLTGTNAEKLLELVDRFKLFAAKPHLEQFIIGSDMNRFEKIRIGEKHLLENLLKNGIMEFNGKEVISRMKMNPSYKTISDKVKVQVLSRVLRMKK
ncbi:hypothetical protein GCK72_020978 [Caenorhabditis remanei]|uniref:BTB domain-containing protein n=1 Tax=Caenorhabditis remanei TaxID=31234 RepID=A0A6A5GGR5_CAERE|nr:hypothetical protein GCK72_020978 [Caenorhabditis remanei]KAF1754417.1 hypothetical protein GCK72_020978 [Caenorhabditis remanei]